MRAQGATESNNLVVKGVPGFYKGRKKHIITTQTEHKCVLDSCRQMETRGWDVTYLPVSDTGIVDVAQVEAAIRCVRACVRVSVRVCADGHCPCPPGFRPDTVLVSVMGVNNEIGVVQPLGEIGEVCRKHKVFFHSGT